jgi:hypothetical protein
VLGPRRYFDSFSQTALGQEVADMFRVYGRIGEGHMASRFRAGRNDNKLAVSYMRFSAFDETELDRIQRVVCKID